MNRQTLFTRLLTIFYFSVILITQSANAYAQTPQEIAKKAFPSVVLLVMEDTNGKPMSLGSGFFVGEGVIASNLHVVEGGARGYAKVVSHKTRYEIEGIVAIDPERDLVLLKIPAERTLPLLLANSDTVEVGESVYAVGNPQGLEGTFSQGIVSSIRAIGSDKLLQITAPISPGSSGGPVLNSKGEVIGVSVATFRVGQNLNFAIPSNYLKALLAKVGPVGPLRGAKASTRQQSILGSLGGRSTEGVIGSQFIWDAEILLGIVAYYHGQYTFSLRNQLREPVQNVYCLVVFYDNNNNPLDVDTIRYSGLIPSGLAKRVSSKVDGSVQKLTTQDGSVRPRTKIEFRILDFQIAK